MALNAALHEAVINPITKKVMPSRTVTVVRCAECGSHIGTLLETVRASSYRAVFVSFTQPSSEGLRAGLQVKSSSVVTAESADREAWCSEHGDRIVKCAELFPPSRRQGVRHLTV